MSSASDPAKLEELSLLALKMMLRRSDDSKALSDQLTGQIKSIVAAVTTVHPSEASRKAMVIAAKGCIQVLKAARDQRPPRKAEAAGTGSTPPPPKTDIRKAPGSSKKAADEPEDAKPVEDSGDHEEKRLKIIMLSVVGVLIIATSIAGYVVWHSLPGTLAIDGAQAGKSATDGTASPPDTSDAGQFIDQIVLAARHNAAPAPPLFGGTLEVTSIMGGHQVVVAGGVPPQVCADAGMVLAEKGLLSINGQTPSITTQQAINDLCAKDGNGATITWSPK